MEKIQLWIGLSVGIIFISAALIVPKIEEYIQDKEEQRTNEKEALENLDEMKKMSQGNFVELVKSDKLDLTYTPTSSSTLAYLSGSDKKEYKEIDKEFKQVSTLFKDMTSVDDGIETYKIINNASTHNDESRNLYSQKVGGFKKEIAKLPENQQGIFNLMMEDMQVEFNFYDNMRKKYFEPEHLFLVNEDNPYMAFGDSLPNILEDVKQIKPVSPVGFKYFGLGAIESDIKITLKEEKLKSARYYDELPSDKREDTVSAYWKNEGSRYGLYLTNVSDEYIKFAEEAFLIYYDSSYTYLHTKQFKDSRSGLDELNRVSYDERSRSGYTWTTFTLKPNETQKIGSVSAEKFEKSSYDGTLRYRYDDSQLGMGGVPRMSKD